MPICNNSHNTLRETIWVESCRMYWTSSKNNAVNEGWRVELSVVSRMSEGISRCDAGEDSGVWMWRRDRRGTIKNPVGEESRAKSLKYRNISLRQFVSHLQRNQCMILASVTASARVAWIIRRLGICQIFCWTDRDIVNSWKFKFIINDFTFRIFGDVHLWGVKVPVVVQ